MLMLRLRCAVRRACLRLGQGIHMPGRHGVVSGEGIVDGRQHLQANQNLRAVNTWKWVRAPVDLTSSER
jgi:hypothetical protein